MGLGSCWGQMHFWGKGYILRVPFAFDRRWPWPAKLIPGTLSWLRRVMGAAECAGLGVLGGREAGSWCTRVPRPLNLPWGSESSWRSFWFCGWLLGYCNEEIFGIMFYLSASHNVYAKTHSQPRLQASLEPENLGMELNIWEFKKIHL